jgi:hypothetical protein
MLALGKGAAALDAAADQPRRTALTHPVGRRRRGLHRRAVSTRLRTRISVGPWALGVRRWARSPGATRLYPKGRTIAPGSRLGFILHPCGFILSNAFILPNRHAADGKGAAHGGGGEARRLGELPLVGS